MTTTMVREAMERLLGPVGQIMRRSVAILRPDEPIGRAARQLEQAGVSGAPVMREGKVIGVVSLADLFEAGGVPMHKVATSGPWLRFERVLDGTGRTVADAMTARVFTLPPEASIVEAAALMRERRVNRVPIVDGGGALRGIVARDDVVAAVAEAFRALRGDGVLDARGSAIAPG